MFKPLIHNNGRANIQLENLTIIAHGKVQDRPIKRRPEMRDKLEYLIAWVEQGVYLTADELCRHSGLTMENLKELNDLKLLTPDTPDGLYSSGLLRWARELAFRLSHGADLNKIVELLNLLLTEWPPLDPDWFEPSEREDEDYRTTLLGTGTNHDDEDTFDLFKKECLIFDADCYEFPDNLYFDYLKLCALNGKASMSEKEFGLRLKVLLGNPVLRQFPNEKYRLVYKGVRLRSGH